MLISSRSKPDFYLGDEVCKNSLSLNHQQDAAQENNIRTFGACRAMLPAVYSPNIHSQLKSIVNSCFLFESRVTFSV